MSKFKDRLSQNSILIADGATGTTLQQAGLPPGAAPERWNLENPDAIRTLQRLGSTVILITHSLTVLKNAEHAFLMCDGKIVDKGSVDRIAGYFEKTCIPCDVHDAREVSLPGGGR